MLLLSWLYCNLNINTFLLWYLASQTIILHKKTLNISARKENNDLGRTQGPDK